MRPERLARAFLLDKEVPTSKVPLATVMTRARAKVKERIQAKVNLKVVLRLRVLSFVTRAHANMEIIADTVTMPKTQDVRLQGL